MDGQAVRRKAALTVILITKLELARNGSLTLDPSALRRQILLK